MMENGTMTPLPVKMSVKEEGGETFQQWLFLHWKIQTKWRWALKEPDVGSHVSRALGVNYQLAKRRPLSLGKPGGIQ